jgi:hypothetical protein
MNSLLSYIQATGKNMSEYGEVLEALAPVFGPLSFGEHPRYQDLDRSRLQERMDETVNVVNWMADSGKADIKASAIQLMGFLGWEPFISRLEQYLSSETQWEHLAAIEALGQTASRRAIEALRVIAVDADPEIREAVRRASTTNMQLD